MALRDRPGFEVWARGKSGNKSHFGLYVYEPNPESNKFEYPHVEIAVIQQDATKDWLPMMVDKNPAKKKYNPRIFCYLDALPDLIAALTRIHKAHSPHATLAEAKPDVHRSVEDEKMRQELDAAVRDFGEFR